MQAHLLGWVLRHRITLHQIDIPNALHLSGSRNVRVTHLHGETVEQGGVVIFLITGAVGGRCLRRFQRLGQGSLNIRFYGGLLLQHGLLRAAEGSALQQLHIPIGLLQQGSSLQLYDDGHDVIRLQHTET